MSEKCLYREFIYKNSHSSKVSTSKKLLFTSLCLVTLYSSPAFSMEHPDETAKDRGGPTTLTCKFGNVERAGVAVVRDYNHTNIPSLRFAVLVGGDSKKTHKLSTGKALPKVNFFGGGCEKADKYSTITAVQELYEETGKAINLPVNTLKDDNPNYYGYAYSDKNLIQLFFYRMDNASVTAITETMAITAKNTKLSHRFKETNKAYAIPLQDLLDRAKLIYKLETEGHYNQAKEENHYIFQTRGKGDGAGREDVYIDPQYMRNLARDIKRDGNNLSNICNKISGGVVK